MDDPVQINHGHDMHAQAMDDENNPHGYQDGYELLLALSRRGLRCYDYELTKDLPQKPEEDGLIDVVVYEFDCDKSKPNRHHILKTEYDLIQVLRTVQKCDRVQKPSKFFVILVNDLSVEIVRLLGGYLSVPPAVFFQHLEGSVDTRTTRAWKVITSIPDTPCSVNKMVSVEGLAVGTLTQYGNPNQPLRNEGRWVPFQHPQNLRAKRVYHRRMHEIGRSSLHDPITITDEANYNHLTIVGEPKPVRGNKYRYMDYGSLVLETKATFYEAESGSFAIAFFDRVPPYEEDVWFPPLYLQPSILHQNFHSVFGQQSKLPKYYLSDHRPIKVFTWMLNLPLTDGSVENLAKGREDGNIALEHFRVARNVYAKSSSGTWTMLCDRMTEKLNGIHESIKRNTTLASSYPIYQRFLTDLQLFIENSESRLYDLPYAPLDPKDHAMVLEKLQRLKRRTESVSQSINTSISILESRNAISEAESLAKLTELAFIFVPLSFASSFFGMNVKEWSTPSVGYFWLMSFLLLGFTYSLRLYVRSQTFLKMEERISNDLTYMGFEVSAPSRQWLRLFYFYTCRHSYRCCTLPSIFFLAVPASVLWGLLSSYRYPRYIPVLITSILALFLSFFIDGVYCWRLLKNDRLMSESFIKHPGRFRPVVFNFAVMGLCFIFLLSSPILFVFIGGVQEVYSWSSGAKAGFIIGFDMLFLGFALMLYMEPDWYHAIRLSVRERTWGRLEKIFPKELPRAG